MLFIFLFHFSCVVILLCLVAVCQPELVLIDCVPCVLHCGHFGC